MKKAFNKNVFYLILMVVFLVLLISVRLKGLYDEVLVTQVYNSVMPSDSSSTDGFSMKTAEKNISLGKDTAAVVLSLRPGDTYKGSMVVKSHSNEKKNFFMTATQDLKVGNADPKVLGIEFSPEKFELNGKEWKLVDYVLTVPKDIEKKDYVGLVSLRDDKSYRTAENMNIVYAVGVEFRVNVTDVPLVYEYTRGIGFDQPSEIAVKFVLKDIQKILAVVFLLLCVLFLVLAVKYSKKEKKELKSKEPSESKPVKKVVSQKTVKKISKVVKAKK